MAVETNDNRSVSKASAGRRFLVGTNVLVATALVVAIVVVAQLIAYRSHLRFDMTASGVNSLSEGTENLLRGLDRNVRVTSLYFETDREDKDQPRYRRAAQDLLNLYESTNRGKVRAEWVNPLKDHEGYAAVWSRLRKKTAFKDELDEYSRPIDRFTTKLQPQISGLLQSELAKTAGSGASLGASAGSAPVAQIDGALNELSGILERASAQVDALGMGDNPQYSRAVGALRTFYSQFTQTLKNIGQFGTEQAQRNPGLPPEQIQLLQGAASRYAELTTALEAESKALQDLQPLKFDEFNTQLAKTANAILVETDDDARVVDFPTVWPPVQQGGQAAGFDSRAFKGEEKLTSAILRATHKEQTAVVFVRYGGQPPFMGAMMMGQRPGEYVSMKLQLEDANFVVEDWDLKTTTTPPTIEPTPTRTIYVVLKPTAPQRGPMGQPNQEPPFAENHRQALLGALGDSGRALFIAGWSPGPFGPFPGPFEYGDYLRDTWGVEVDTSALLIETMNTAPGEYRVARQDFFHMREVSVTSHDIVSGALARQVGLPMCAPLKLADPPPTGVELERLLYLSSRDGVWGETNLQGFLEQARQGDPIKLDDADPRGPFDLAAAAKKGDAKIVVVSSAQFAVDQVAFARTLAMTSQGFGIRSINPGNVSLLVNSLHWLNDNAEFMNIGKPIEAAVLEIGSESKVKMVQALTIFAWPMLALIGGGMVWWVRRR